jgi:glycyl-tRNA synthetase beta chain
MFDIGLEPTGSKDPYALRRAANAIVKILAETGLPLTVSDLISLTDVGILETLADNRNETGDKLRAFFRERVEFYMRTVRDLPYDVVNAVLAVGSENIREAIDLAEALTAERGSEDLLAVSASFKRMKNILTQALAKGLFDQNSSTVDIRQWLNGPEEILLLLTAGRVKEVVDILIAEHKYRDAIQHIASLRPIIDEFFDKVMVMADDPEIRQSRLDLIAMVLGNFSSLADFSELVSA